MLHVCCGHSKSRSGRQPVSQAGGRQAGRNSSVLTELAVVFVLHMFVLHIQLTSLAGVNASNVAGENCSMFDICSVCYVQFLPWNAVLGIC